MKNVIRLVMALAIMPFLAIAQKTIKPATTNSYAETDAKALAIPEASTKSVQGLADYFRSVVIGEDKLVRTAYVWVAENMQYDIANMYSFNFTEKNEDKIKRALNSHKGVCADYAALLNGICTKLGITSYIVTGYTRQNNMTNYLPHAWCVAKVNGKWDIYDPTWGSGVIMNGKFVRKLDSAYYKANPKLMIKSHMPFDPIWQLLDSVITNEEFASMKNGLDKPYYNYNDSIAQWEKQTELEKMIASSRRVEQMGVNNDLIYQYLSTTKQNAAITEQNSAVTVYNSALIHYDDAVANYNKFIDYRNKQFKPQKEDSVIQQMVDLPALQMDTAKTILKDLKSPAGTMVTMLTQMYKSMDDILKQIHEQQDFVKKYLPKSKIGRMAMFRFQVK